MDLIGLMIYMTMVASMEVDLEQLTPENAALLKRLMEEIDDPNGWVQDLQNQRNQVQTQRNQITPEEKERLRIFFAQKPGFKDLFKKPEPELEPVDIQRMEYDILKRKQTLREIPIKSSSDIGEGFDNLDSVNHIDLNTRLNAVEISACTIIDQLKAMGVFPEQASITQQFKRLKVSEGGKGRTEKVQIVTGHREQIKPSGFLDLFKKRAKEQENPMPQPGGL